MHPLKSFICFARRLLLAFFRVRTIGARALVIRDHEILLIKHTYQKGWYTIGGAVEKGESALQAVKRELYEEVGLKTISSPELFGIYFSRNESRDDHVVLYVVKDFTIKEVDSEEIAEKKWFRFDNLPDDISLATKRRIDEYLGKSSKSDKW
jgi:8-oxo-dGTP pyrophosphatase MutT (NUDIX family)